MISVKNVSKVYQLDEETFVALKNITLTIKLGEFTAILGPSGSGKSTLMHIIGLLDTPSSGELLVEGNDTARLSDAERSSLRNQFVGFVFQQFNLINSLTVLENVLLPTVYTRKKLNFMPKIHAYLLLKRIGMDKKAKFFPNRLSGGEQQRVAIARALIMKPKIILADEPTGNLDTKTGEKILDLLTKLNRKDRITVVIVTHEKHVARRAKRKIYLRDGEIVRS